VRICLIAVLYLFARVVTKIVYSRGYRGFFVHDMKNNRFVRVPRYDVSEKIERYLNAAFVENKALETIWNREPLRHMLEFNLEDDLDVPTRTQEGSRQLIREALEYYVLEKLSTHLTDYFNDERFRRENLTELVRDDIPDILLKNRFLELFSRPMEDRPAFVNRAKPGVRDSARSWSYVGGITASRSKTGELYQRFDLVLPTGSKVKRVDRNTINIETNKFIMAIAVNFDSFLTNLPYGFEPYYLSLDSNLDTGIYMITVELKVAFKLGILSPAGREYYRWLDSFLDCLEEAISESTFFESIGWDSAVTVLQCLGDETKRRRSEVRKKSE